MADSFQDLSSAFQQFHQGVQNLQMQRAIQGANDQVSNIRNQEMDEGQRLSQLRGVASNLTMQLAGFGAPLDRIQAAVSGINPMQQSPQNAFEGLSSSDPAVRQRSQAAVDIEHQNKMQELAPMRMMAVARLNEQHDTHVNNELDKFRSAVDASSKVRSAVGQAALTQQKAEKIKALLLDKPNPSVDDLNQIPGFQANEAASAVASMVQGASPTDAQIKNFAAKTGISDLQSAKQFLSNHPEPAKLGAFLNLYLQSANRESALAQSQLEDNVFSLAKSSMNVYGLAPEQFKQQVAARIPGASPEDIIVDPKAGTVTTKERAEQEDRFRNFMKAVPAAKSRLQANPNDQVALSFLQKHGYTRDSFMKTPPSQIRQDAIYRMKTKEF